jgi:hypothetical protein
MVENPVSRKELASSISCEFEYNSYAGVPAIASERFFALRRSNGKAPDDGLFMRLNASPRTPCSVCAPNRGVATEVHNHVKMDITVVTGRPGRLCALLLDCKKILLIKGLI